MKIVRNNIIPFKGFAAIALFPFLFIRKGIVIHETLIRHEKTHFEQQKEMLFVLFYVWYVIEYLARLIGWLLRLGWKQFTTASHLAYRNISFEQEAYNNQDNPSYLANRKRFAWIKYL